MTRTLLTSRLFASLLAICVGTAAHAQTTAPTTEPAQAETPAPAPAPTADTVVATVDGREITLGEVIALRQALPEQYQRLPDEVLHTGLIEQLIDLVLLEQAAEKAGLANTPAITLRLQNERRSVLANAYVRDALEKRLTDEAIAARYKADFTDQPQVEEVRAAHILVPELEAAQALKKQLDEGADFAALAAEHGTDGTAGRGGDLGWFVHSDMVPEFADAAFALEPGTVSAPVQSPFGWHLIKLDERRPRPAPPLEQVRETLVEKMTEEITAQIMAEIREKAKIARPTPGIQPSAIREDKLLD